jgi:5'-deoxynucleotidase YfbR-like HD superfamily hydrolase
MAFEKEYRMMSFVPRWAIAPRHRHQTLDSHSYYVTLYASQICDVIGVLPETKLAVLDYALRHDTFETWTSDVPGPAKRATVDPVRTEEYHGQFKAVNRDYARYAEPPIPLVKLIVKAADMVDEIFFLKTEISMGNGMVHGLYERSKERLVQALNKIEEVRPGAAEILYRRLNEELERLVDKGAYIPYKDEDLR